MNFKFKNEETEFKLVDFVIQKGIPTGSKYFGYPYNDIDYIVNARDLQNKCHELGEYYTPETILNNNFNLKFMNLKLKNKECIVYDLIIVGDFEFEVWVNSTKFFYSVITINHTLFEIFKNKSARVQLFEILKNYFRCNILKTILSTNKNTNILEIGMSGEGVLDPFSEEVYNLDLKNCSHYNNQN